MIAAGPLAQGVLTGRYDSEYLPTSLHGLRRLGLRHVAFAPTKTNFHRFQPLLTELRAIAASHNVTPAAVALAWTVSHDPVVVIPGASTIEQLEANIAAGDLTLTADETEALAAAARRFQHPGL